MLIYCPECELQISNRAISCPHCGFPLVPTASIQSRKAPKHKRLPNGFGQITKLNNKQLRNPYRAMITVKKTSEGKPVCKILKPNGYFATYNEAYEALIEYNKNPYDLNDDITVAELYDKWSKEYFKTLKSDTSVRTITSAWNYCGSLYDMRAKDVRARHIKGVMTDGEFKYKGEVRKPSPSTQERIKSLFNLMYDYALEYELVDKNYARTFDISDDIRDEAEKAKRGHLSFKEDELKKLWDNVTNLPYVDLVLINCYSGWRPQEIGLIRLENVYLDKWVFIGGMKTDSGTDRPVPIHTAIRPLIKKYYDEAVELGSEYLINTTDATSHKYNKKMTYDKYRHRFDKVIKSLELNPEHRAHDCRKTFITLAKKYDIDEYAIKYMVGHKIDDITEAIYTDRDTEWLCGEIEKIKVNVKSC